VRVLFKNQFTKQIEKLRDNNLKAEVRNIIISVEDCNSILEIKNLKKLKGYKSFYRIRTGDYRIGIKVEDGIVTFAAFDHRKDIYKYFP
jgi:mRNA interferase RelE/StbE